MILYIGNEEVKRDQNPKERKKVQFSSTLDG